MAPKLVFVDRRGRQWNVPRLGGGGRRRSAGLTVLRQSTVDNHTGSGYWVRAYQAVEHTGWAAAQHLRGGMVISITRPLGQPAFVPANQKRNYDYEPTVGGPGTVTRLYWRLSATNGTDATEGAKLLPDRPDANFNVNQNSDRIRVGFFDINIRGDVTTGGSYRKIRR